MIGIWIFTFFITTGTLKISQTFGTILSLFWIIVIIASLILSIIHLTRHKEKALAITALVISSLIIIMQVLYLVLDSMYDIG